MIQKEEFLTKEEIDSLLEDAEIISDSDSDSKNNENLNQNDSLKNKRPNLIENMYNKSLLSPQQKQNVELLLDVEAEIRVELGRTYLKIKDILSLGEGSIIELNKSANEPVDLIVNDQLFAKGEVVVIDENFGTRITYILNSKDQILNKLES